MNYLTPGTSIVGYAYNAALICEECARKLGIAKALEYGDSYMWGDCGSAEDTLNAWASIAGIDRDCADTNDFPAPVFASDEHEDFQHCDNSDCGHDCIGHDYDDCRKGTK